MISGGRAASGPAGSDSVVGFDAILAGLLSEAGEDVILRFVPKEVVNNCLNSYGSNEGVTVTTPGKPKPGATIRCIWKGTGAYPTYGKVDDLIVLSQKW
jgi:hypothetical protein